MWREFMLPSEGLLGGIGLPHCGSEKYSSLLHAFDHLSGSGSDLTWGTEIAPVCPTLIGDNVCTTHGWFLNIWCTGNLWPK